MSRSAKSCQTTGLVKVDRPAAGVVARGGGGEAVAGAGRWLAAGGRVGPPTRTSCHCWWLALRVGGLHDVGAVGGGRALDLQGLVAVAVDQPDVVAVRVGEPELLVRPVVVGPLHDGCTVGGGRAVDVQHLARVPRPDPVVAAAGVDELPLLIGLVVSGPLDDSAAVVRRLGVHIQRLAAVAVDQHVRGVRIHRRRRCLGCAEGDQAGRPKHRRDGSGRGCAPGASACRHRRGLAVRSHGDSSVQAYPQ